jgi:hypothetical protein
MATIPIETSTKVRVESLVLDRENPRLLEGKTTDESIIAQLYRGEELGELIQSIAANGYMDIEPMIVLEAREPGFLTVLEGNRRLAAIRLFRETSLLAQIARTEGLRIQLPEISSQHRATLDTVSVFRVSDRTAARSFIGFKHINGAAKWESYAKAKFAAEWFRSGNVSLEEIADKIGDKHDTIKRMIAAIYVLDQAKTAGIFAISDRKAIRFNFSHLYTALSRTTYMKFLGLDTAWSSYEPRPDPIPSDRLKELREVLVWIYGSKADDQEPLVQSQNPDIKLLGEAIVNTEGLHILRAGGSLDEAHSSTQPPEAKLSSALIRARAILREAVTNLRGYDGADQSLLSIAEDITETAQTIRDRMKTKFTAAAKKVD